MKVKEVKKRIEDLEDVYDNMIRIQECCLRNDDAKDSIKFLEDSASLNTTLCDLASAMARYIHDEIHRLQDIIDEAVVKIN